MWRERVIENMSCREHELFDKKWNALLRKKGCYFMLMWSVLSIDSPYLESDSLSLPRMILKYFFPFSIFYGPFCSGATISL